MTPVCIGRAIVAGLALVTATLHAQVPDAGRGSALYENHCQVCHTSRVHTRNQRLPLTRAEVREIVDKWQAQQQLTWNASDIEDVVEFLNRTHYKFD